MYSLHTFKGVVLMNMGIYGGSVSSRSSQSVDPLIKNKRDIRCCDELLSHPRSVTPSSVLGKHRGDSLIVRKENKPVIETVDLVSLEMALKDRPLEVDVPLESSDFKHFSSLERDIDRFIRSQNRSVCLLGEGFNLKDYQEIDKRVPSEGRVFIGSDEDIYLKKEELGLAQYIIIDYSRISQVDSLNYLLEGKKGELYPRIIGLLSQKDHSVTAMSFQSRWSDYCVLDSQERVSSRDDGKTITLEDRTEQMEEEPSVSGIEELPIFGQFYKLEGLGSPSFQEKRVHLLGADPSHPCVMYHMARSLNAGFDVKCVEGSYPRDIPVVSSVDIQNCCSLKARTVGKLGGDVEDYSSSVLLHAGNFDAVGGSYFVRDGTVSRIKAPQTMFVVSELTHEQWLYLGYLQHKNPRLSIAGLEGVEAPKESVLTSQTALVNVKTNRRV